MFLFDLDGTIADSRDAILGAYGTAMKEVLGYTIEPDSEHKHELLRRRPIEYFQQHYPPHSTTLAERYAQVYRSDSVAPFDGMQDLIVELIDIGPVGIVSNKGRNRIIEDLEKIGIDPISLAVIVGAEDTPERKPHPAPIQKALQELDATGQAYFYVGDGPHDVLAARGAGAIEVAVTWGYYPELELRALEPHHAVTDVVNLRKILLAGAQ